MENNRDDNFLTALYNLMEKKIDEKLEPINNNLKSAIAEAEEIKGIMTYTKKTDTKKTDTKETKKNQGITVNIKETKENIKELESVNIPKLYNNSDNLDKSKNDTENKEDVYNEIKELKAELTDINDTLIRIDNNNAEICSVCDRIIEIAKKWMNQWKNLSNQKIVIKIFG